MRWFGVLLIGCAVRPTDRDGDGWLSNTDCDDDNYAVAPGRPEIPYDGIDNDCDRNTSDQDADLDGVEIPEDCDDQDPTIPGVEIPYDGIDNDCSASTPDDDLDGDGFLAAVDCDDSSAAAFPGGVEVPYDGIDNDCDPSTLDGDLDQDGLDGADDCDDSDPEVGGPVDWYEDCDADGYAAELAAFVNTCEAPPNPVTCSFGSWTDVAPMDPGTPISTTDCNDDEIQARPGQPGWFTAPMAGVFGPAAYDYDCDGEALHEFGVFACFPDPVSAGCVTLEGFDSFVPCGASGVFYETCVVGLPQCLPGEPLDAVAACH